MDGELQPMITFTDRIKQNEFIKKILLKIMKNERRKKSRKKFFNK